MQASLVLFAAAGLTLAAAGEAAPFAVQGRVLRSGGRPATQGTVELRWPGHEDTFTPVSAPIREDGSYRIDARIDRDTVPVRQLTVTAMAYACEIVEKPLPVGGGDGSGGAIVVDFEVKSSTLNGILNIFRCCILTWGALTVMLPAFLLGAAVTAFVPGQYVLSLLGPDAPRHKAYGAAVGAGMVLSLCSCNVVPLFAGIWRRGAGTGPAFAFLYAGPAVSLVTLVFTCQVIGLPFAVFRGLAVAVIAVVTGVLMARLFGQGRLEGGAPLAALPADGAGPGRGATGTLLAALLYLLVVGAFRVSPVTRLALTAPAALAIVAVAVFKLGRSNTRLWLRETWGLIRLVVPILLPAVLIIGLLAMHTPLTVTRWMSGNNSLGANAGAALFGSLMYFPILTEVALAKALLKVMGAGIGPVMALILTAPGLSLPGMIILRNVVGWKRLLTYVGIVTVLAALAGALFGSQWGAYICSCAI